jgi:hypothetical protein
MNWSLVRRGQKYDPDALEVHPDARLLHVVRLFGFIRDIELELQNCWFLLVAMYFLLPWMEMQ